MSELTGCRACPHYSAGIMSVLDRRWGHQCNYHGRGNPRLIRWAVEGRCLPVEIPDWCPLPQAGDAQR